MKSGRFETFGTLNRKLQKIKKMKINTPVHIKQNLLTTKLNTHHIFTLNKVKNDIIHGMQCINIINKIINQYQPAEQQGLKSTIRVIEQVMESTVRLIEKDLQSTVIQRDLESKL